MIHRKIILPAALKQNKEVVKKKNKTTTGKREAAIIKNRLETYGCYMSSVQKVLSRKMRRSLLREIQLMCCEKFGLKTDRAAWRSKTGYLSWFCSNWSRISDFVTLISKRLRYDDIKAIRKYFDQIPCEKALNSISTFIDDYSETRYDLENFLVYFQKLPSMKLETTNLLKLSYD